MDTRTLAMVHNPEALATTLLVIAIDRFGVECLEWLPSVMEEELQGLAKAEVPQRNFDKLHGLILSLTSDRFYQEPKIFMKVCNALDPNGPVMFGSFDPPSPFDMAWAVTEMRLHEPATSEGLKKKFNDHVLDTIRFILMDDGIIAPPKYLDFVGKVGNVGVVGGKGPAMFEGVHKTQGAKADMIDRRVGIRFQGLARQLDAISLEDGDMSEIEDMVDSLLSG